MIYIDYKDTRPIYEQIVEKFKILILNGVLEEDSKMPSVRSLAMELAINPNTIQKAYSKLESDGYIYSVKGKGNFVSYNEKMMDEKKREIELKCKALLKEAKEVGISSKEVIEMMKKMKEGSE